MRSILESITKRLAEAWKSPEIPSRGHYYRCKCQRPIYFRNSMCLGCQSPLGYDPESTRLISLLEGPEPDTWQAAGGGASKTVWTRCENFHSPIGCNWLKPVAESSPHCIACRLNRTVPTADQPENAAWWRKIENAKRRLVAQLLRLDLPLKSKVNEDPERGVMFDFLRSSEGKHVLTGHASGLITINIEEADDANRERIRHQMHEPYRTLLGHFRHEIGHYYWDRLVMDTPWLDKFRELFGDEREDYAAALKRNYEQGPPANWADRHITSYASVHPWEDWAETWAHYLHVVDSLDTALGFGLRGQEVEAVVEPYTVKDLYDPTAPDAQRVILLFNSWVQLTTVLNEMARSMGQHDFYPFVMSRPVLRKMHFIQMVVKSCHGMKPS